MCGFEMSQVVGCVLKPVENIIFNGRHVKRRAQPPFTQNPDSATEATSTRSKIMKDG